MCNGCQCLQVEHWPRGVKAFLCGCAIVRTPIRVLEIMPEDVGEVRIDTPVWCGINKEVIDDGSGNQI